MTNKKSISRRPLSRKRLKKSIKRLPNKKRTRTSSKIIYSSGGFNQRQRKQIMPTVSLGLIPSGYTSNIKAVSYEELINFVNNSINYGPQIVSLPVPPERHAFLVDIQNDRIMISDWGGYENKTRGEYQIQGRRNPNYMPNWKQYSDFMRELERKYNLYVEYYPKDVELVEKSNIVNNKCNGGGCSHYIYDWVKKYYPTYS